MKKKELVIVGPGLIGSKHIELITNNRRCFLSAIVAPNHEHDKKIAENLGVPLYFNLDKLFKDISPDGVIICSPNKFHVAQSILCIKKKIPVLVEKPISHSYKSGLKVIHELEKNNAKLLVGHHRTYSPIIAEAKKIIKTNKIGQVVTLMGSALFYKPSKYFKDGPWRKKIGGGPILINLIHEIGNFRALCGEIESVSAVASKKIRKFEVEDTVALIFSFRSGALGTFLLSDTAASPKSWEQTSGENPSFAHYPDEDCYVLSGTRGSLSMPSMKLRIYPQNIIPSWQSNFKTEFIKIKKIDPLDAQLNHFLDVIEGKSEPRVSAYDGLENLRILEAILKSTRLKKTIHV